MKLVRKFLEHRLMAKGLGIITAPKVKNPKDIVFLHIGKNAGKQIEFLGDQLRLRDGLRIVKAPHNFHLNQLPSQYQYFFSIRHPRSRFLSAFESRRRKIFDEFKNSSVYERRAFENFESANQLLESISGNCIERQRAFSAINSIVHMCDEQCNWFSQAGYFLECRPPIGIIRQEFLVEDFNFIFDPLSVGELRLSISEDRRKADKSNYDASHMLSDRALKNLNNVFLKDIVFYEYCSKWIEQKKSQSSSGSLEI